MNPLKTTLCGSFNRFGDLLSETIARFEDLGIRVLSPRSGEVESVHQNFAFLKGDASRDKRLTEDAHLEAIRNSDFVWIINTDGHLGKSLAFEMGFAHSLGKRIFSASDLEDDPIGTYARKVSLPVHAAKLAKSGRSPGSVTFLLAPEQIIGQLQATIVKMAALIHEADNPLPIHHARELRVQAKEAVRLLGAFGS